MTSIDKIRAAFELTNSRDHRRQPPKGNNYIDPMAQADWESFQKGWQASRAAVVVELTAEYELPPTMDMQALVSAIRQQDIATIEAQGLKVAP